MRKRKDDISIHRALAIVMNDGARPEHISVSRWAAIVRHITVRVFGFQAANR